MQPALPSLHPRTAPLQDAATDPVGGLSDSLPIRPDRGSTTPEELWEEQVRKRPRRKRPSTPPPPPFHPEDEHGIDDYA